jgi:hypothetical protein
MYIGTKREIRGLQEVHPDTFMNAVAMREHMPEKLRDFGVTGAVVALPDNASVDMMRAAKEYVDNHVLWDAVGDQAPLGMRSVSWEESQKFFGGKSNSSFNSMRIEEKQAEFQGLLDILKSGEPDAAAATLERLLSSEATQRANPVYALNSEYDKALSVAEEQKPYGGQKEPFDLQHEAARRADQVIEATEGQMRRKFERDFRKQAEAMWFQEPGPKAISELKVSGIKYKSLATDYDKDSVSRIVRRWPGLVKENGYWGLDDASARYGFDSADHLFQMLMDHPTREAYVDRFVSQGMQRHEDEIALTAVERLAIMVDQELAVMREAAGEGTVKNDMMPEGMTEVMPNPTDPRIKAAIEKRVGIKRAADLEQKTNYDNLKAAMQMSAKNAKIAYREGKLDEAIRQKIRQKNLVTSLRVEMDARKERDSIGGDVAKIIRQFGKARGVDPIYLDAAIDLLRPLSRPMGLGRKLDNYQNVSASPMPLKEAFERASGNGELMPIDVEDLYALRSKNPKDIDLNDMNDVLTAVKILYHFAKIENRQLSAQKEGDFNRLIGNLIVSGLESAGPRGYAGPKTAGEKLQAKAAGELAVSRTTKYWMSTRRTEFLNRDLDGWKYEGDHFNAMTQPIQRGVQDFLAMKDDIDARYLEAHRIFEKAVGMRTEQWFRQKVSIPGMARPITRDMVWSAYSCMHNPANLKTVRSIFNDVQLAYIRSLITLAEHNLFVAHAEHFQYFKDRIWQLSYEMYGVYPKEVEGVYWPIKIDPDLNVESEALVSRSATQNLWQTAFDSPVVPSPFLKARKGTTEPADLTYAWILPRLQQTAKWLALAKPLRDVQRIVSNRDWMNMVVNTRGRAWWDQYRPQLQDIANPRRNMPTGGLNELIDTARKVSVLHTLGLNLSTAVKHYFEWMLSADKLGLGICLRGFMAFYGSLPYDLVTRQPTAFTDINNESVQMAHSTHSYDREIQDFQAAIAGYPPFMRFMLNHCMDLIKFSDMAMRYPIYLEAKGQALEGRGKSGKQLVKDLGRLPTEAEAIAHAEAIIRLTKPVTGPENLPAIGRQQGVSRLAFTYGTYFNGVLNNLQEDYARWRYDPNYNFFHFSKALFLLLVLTPLLTESAVHRRTPRDTTEGALWVSEYALGLLPGIGQAFQGGLWAYEHHNPKVEGKLPPGLDFVGNFGNAFLDGLNYATGKPVNQDWWVHVLEAAGTMPIDNPLAGFPTRQMITAAKGYLDLKSGKSDTGWSLIDRGARFEQRDEGRRSRAQGWPKPGAGGRQLYRTGDCGPKRGAGPEHVFAKSD